eukprot:284817645_2
MLQIQNCYGTAESLRGSSCPGRSQFPKEIDNALPISHRVETGVRQDLAKMLLFSDGKLSLLSHLLLFKESRSWKSSRNIFNSCPNFLRHLHLHEVKKHLIPAQELRLQASTCCAAVTQRCCGIPLGGLNARETAHVNNHCGVSIAASPDNGRRDFACIGNRAVPTLGVGLPEHRLLYLEKRPNVRQDHLCRHECPFVLNVLGKLPQCLAFFREVQLYCHTPSADHPPSPIYLLRTLHILPSALRPLAIAAELAENILLTDYIHLLKMFFATEGWSLLEHTYMLHIWTVKQNRRAFRTIKRKCLLRILDNLRTCTTSLIPSAIPVFLTIVSLFPEIHQAVGTCHHIDEFSSATDSTITGAVPDVCCVQKVPKFRTSLWRDLGRHESGRSQKTGKVMFTFLQLIKKYCKSILTALRFHLRYLSSISSRGMPWNHLSCSHCTISATSSHMNTKNMAQMAYHLPLLAPCVPAHRSFEALASLCVASIPSQAGSDAQLSNFKAAGENQDTSVELTQTLKLLAAPLCSTPLRHSAFENHFL